MLKTGLGRADVLVVAVLLWPQPAPAALYTVERQDGLFSVAEAMNSAGDLVGQIFVPDPWGWHATLVRGGRSVDLGTLPGGDVADATDINDAGEIVGYSNAGDSATHAFLYDAAGMHDLGAIGIGKRPRINNAGDIAGTRYDGRFFAYLRGHDGTTIDIPKFDGGTVNYAAGIDARGRVAGHSNSGTFPGYHAFLYDAGTLTDLGVLPTGSESFAYDMNASGDVVGQADAVLYSDYHAVLWRDGAIRDLGILGGGRGASWPSQINGAGQVVGTSSVPGGGDTHAFLWDERHGLRDLNDLIPPDSGWVLEQGQAIAGTGDIAGFGFLNGEGHNYRLTASDPCRDIPGSALQQPRLRMGRRFVFSGQLSGARTPAIDPASGGVRLLLASSGRDAAFDATVPGGAGWRCSGSGRTWTYHARAAERALDGLTRVRLRRLGTDPGAFHVELAGRLGSTAGGLSTSGALDATIMIGPPIVGTAECGEATFPQQ